MVDVKTVQADAQKAEVAVNGFWAKVVAFVKAHPKTSIAIAVAVVVVAIVVL